MRPLHNSWRAPPRFGGAARQSERLPHEVYVTTFGRRSFAPGPEPRSISAAGVGVAYGNVLPCEPSGHCRPHDHIRPDAIFRAERVSSTSSAAECPSWRAFCAAISAEIATSPANPVRRASPQEMITRRLAGPSRENAGYSRISGCWSPARSPRLAVPPLVWPRSEALQRVLIQPGYPLLQNDQFTSRPLPNPRSRRTMLVK